MGNRCFGFNRYTGKSFSVPIDGTIDYDGKKLKCYKTNVHNALELRPVDKFESYENVLQENVCPWFSGNILYVIIILVLVYFVYTTFLSDKTKKLKYV